MVGGCWWVGLCLSEILYHFGIYQHPWICWPPFLAAALGFTVLVLGGYLRPGDGRADPVRYPLVFLFQPLWSTDHYRRLLTTALVLGATLPLVHAEARVVHQPVSLARQADQVQDALTDARVLETIHSQERDQALRTGKGDADQEQLMVQKYRALQAKLLEILPRIRAGVPFDQRDLQLNSFRIRDYWQKVYVTPDQQLRTRDGSSPSSHLNQPLDYETLLRQRLQERSSHLY